MTVHSEREARESLQQLHSEVRDYINRVLLPQVDNNSARVIGDDKDPLLCYRLGADNGELYYEEVKL